MNTLLKREYDLTDGREIEIEEYEQLLIARIQTLSIQLQAGSKDIVVELADATEELALLYGDGTIDAEIKRLRVERGRLTHVAVESA